MVCASCRNRLDSNRVCVHVCDLRAWNTRTLWAPGLQSISYRKTHNTGKLNPWERTYWLTSHHPGESSVNVYFSYTLQSESYSKRSYSGYAAAFYNETCYTRWREWILVHRVSLRLSLIIRQRAGARLATRSRGFVASSQSTTPAVLSSARPPRHPETAFNGMDVDRGVEVARGLRETGLVELCHRPRATAEAGGVGERRFWGTVLFWTPRGD